MGRLMRYGVDGDSVEFVVSGILSKKKMVSYLRKERVNILPAMVYLYRIPKGILALPRFFK